MRTYPKIFLFLISVLSSTWCYASTLQTLTLSVKQTSLNKDANTTLKAEAVYSDQTTKDVTDTVAWLIDHPDAIQIQSHTLTAKQDKAVILRAKLDSQTSNAVTLDLYWEVEGYRLPPEPDPTVNNATLLGVDVNGNGVRDDVERYIVETYGKEKITIEIGFQVARAYNTVIEHPEKAWETDKILSAAQDCASYFEDDAELFGDPILLDTDIVTSKKFKSVQLNTELRIRAYLEYNRNLSGGIFTLKHSNELKQECTFNIKKMLKARK